MVLLSPILFKAKSLTMKPNFTLRLYVHSFTSVFTRLKQNILRVGLTTLLFFVIVDTKAGESNSLNPLSITANNNSFVSSSPSTGTESLRTNLYLLNTGNNSTILADGVLAEYNNLYHDGVTLEDAYKFTNIKENLGIARHSKTLAIERRPIIGTTDTMFFKLWKTTQRHYQFEFIATNISRPGMQAILQDSYLGINTVLSLTGSTKVNFFINSIPASANPERFRIIYTTSFASSTLPVTFTSIKGSQVNTRISIDWRVENEINIASYEVEHSVNGTGFTKLNTVYVAGNNALGIYTSIHEKPSAGNNFYRIKSVDKDGVKKYSPIVKVNIGKVGQGTITIYPNPVRGSIINLQFTNQLTGIYQVRITNSTGQMVFSNKFPVNSSNISQPLVTNNALKTGIYQVEIIKPDNTVEIQKALVQQ